MNKATRKLNQRAIAAAHRRSSGASFASIAEFFGVSKDKARTLVGRGERLINTTHNTTHNTQHMKNLKSCNTTHAEQRLDLNLQFALEMLTTIAKSGLLSDDLSDRLTVAVGSLEEDRLDVLRLIAERKLEMMQ